MTRKLKNIELNRLTVDEFKQEEKTPLILVLDDIRSLHNVGSVFRTADAFRLEAIYLCGITGRPPHKDIYRTALGATESVDWHYFPEATEAIALLHKNDYLVWALEQTSNSLPLNEITINAQQKHALILGNEVTGVQEVLLTQADCCVEIPQSGTKHSLNVSVATGIAAWEFFRALSPTPLTQ